MRTNDHSQDVNRGRRRLIAASAATLAAAPLGLVRSMSGTAAPPATPINRHCRTSRSRVT
ncbi:hypothetical protein SAMN05519104_8310 [Rhizobiales bacterium GAS188]|nr:hypothetical protein SAMN05519104_8310 [Rhizobiales bacterium GAS188]